jgi:hypothetical protein
MATIAREVLNTQGMRLPIFCGGYSRVGFNVGGSWTGVLTPYVSFDGVNFLTFPGGVQPLTPFAAGSQVQTITANGNWFADVNNAVAMALVLTTLTTGAPVVTLAAAIDSSWQDAYLAPSSHFVEQDAGANAQNQITQALQTNRAWRCRKVSGGFSGAAPAAPVKLTISDGPSSILWAEYVSTAQFTLNLPEDPRIAGVSGGGVVGTPGNTMVVTLAAAGGSVGSSLSAEFIPA